MREMTAATCAPCKTLSVTQLYCCFPLETLLKPRHGVLPVNFRSRQEVTEGINFLFDQLMTEPFGGIDYRAGERLEAGAVYPPSPDCGCEVHLLPREKGEGSARDREADYVAGLVAGLLASGTQVSDHGVLRPVRPGDICILLRSVKDKAAVYLEGFAIHLVSPACIIS